jgi:hypothetical protein
MMIILHMVWRISTWQPLMVAMTTTKALAATAKKINHKGEADEEEEKMRRGCR